MPGILVAEVAPVRGVRCSESVKGKQFSAPGSREIVIGSALRRKAIGQRNHPTARPCRLEDLAPMSRPERDAAPEHDLAWDSDGEAYMLCPHCRLPLGDSTYAADDDEARLVHAECKAQLIVRASQKEEEGRLKKDAVLKRQQREKYDLGWRVEGIPCNWGPAGRLGCGPIPNNLCGLVWDEASKRVYVVPTQENSAAVNLEYLSLALQVRVREGREPLFSLDPKDVCGAETQDRHSLWQTKRFEPAWLEGTSLGEVMFQADYHLKELSMGEFAQPVVGMSSAFDFCHAEDFAKEWSAREWFVVKKAEVQLTEDNLMVPLVKMGVEARETSMGDAGLMDVPLTRPDHPLVKYAQAFTHYFDLIAERKSVVYHLREMAKATVLAKFLMENNAHLDGQLLALAGEPAQRPSCKEIPQLWNEHRAAQVQVVDGQIVGSEDGGLPSRMLGVYGGVDAGLIGRVGRAPPMRVAAARVPTLTARMVSARAAVPEFAIGAPEVPKGVDLGLDKFDLAAAGVVAEDKLGSWDGEAFLGKAFWQSLSGSNIVEEDRCLLKNVFNPCLSDRRSEGNLFVPPSNSLAYVSMLRGLVEEEVAVQKERREHFLSADFEAGNAGSLFPSSWTPLLAMSHGQGPAGASQRLHARPDYRADAGRLVSSATPAFDKSTEDGTRFRIYKVGSLEVRTTQELEGEEVVGAVFSSRAPARAPGDEAWSSVAKVDRIAKVAEYVEKTETGARRFYVALETEQGDAVVTEMRLNQKAAWVENPANLEYRNSLAKVVRAADLSGTGITARDARCLFDGEAERGSCASRTGCKRFSHGFFLGLLPARLKAWDALSEEELLAAEELGISGTAAWNEGATEAFNLTWESLGQIRREAAQTLGYTEASWGSAGPAESLQSKTAGVIEKRTEKKDWSELSQAEQEERMAKWFRENYGEAGAFDNLA